MKRNLDTGSPLAIFLTLVAIVLTLPSACQRDIKSETQSASAAQAKEEKATNSRLHTITIDGVPLHVEIAQDDETLASGLMYRERLADDEGMLFVFESTRILSFWMRNTFIPLDIAFIDENGTIVDIRHMAALDESKQYISKAPALYALEVNAGWFEKHNLKVGSKVIF